MIQPQTPRLSSHTFAEQLLSADELVLKTIYARNYRVAEQYVIQNSGTTEDARDVYQEAFMAVWRNIHLNKFTPADENEFGAYLFRVTKNKWIDQLRSSKNKRIVELANDEPGEWIDEDVTETDMYIDAVKKQFGKLGERCRNLLELFYFKKQSLAKIAEQFSWTEASAKNNKYRCLKQLREMVTSNGK